MRRFAALVAPGRPVLDVACGRGRHLRYFRARGHPVVGVDIDVSGLCDLAGTEGVEIVAADLEGDRPWPLEGRQFAGIVVTNYLYRPLFSRLLDSLLEGGVLIYETFARGNEKFGRPRNPHHLLRDGELLEAVRGRLHVVAYEHGLIHRPKTAAIERLCAVRHPPAAGDPVYPLDASDL